LASLKNCNNVSNPTLELPYTLSHLFRYNFTHLETSTFGIADVSFDCSRAKTPSICICICSQWMRLLRSPRHCGFVSQGHVGVRVGEPHRPAKPIITIMAIIIVMITVGVIKSGSKCDNYGQRSRASCKQKL